MNPVYWIKQYIQRIVNLLQYMAADELLKHFWNSYGSKQNNWILVVCGSAASWLIQKIVNSKGGLHNSLARQIRLLPFTLHETESFFKVGFYQFVNPFIP